MSFATRKRVNNHAQIAVFAHACCVRWSWCAPRITNIHTPILLCTPFVRERAYECEHEHLGARVLRTGTKTYTFVHNTHTMHRFRTLSKRSRCLWVSRPAATRCGISDVLCISSHELRSATARVYCLCARATQNMCCDARMTPCCARTYLPACILLASVCACSFEKCLIATRT